jgi:hypothetical protein
LVALVRLSGGCLLLLTEEVVGVFVRFFRAASSHKQILKSQTSKSIFKASFLDTYLNESMEINL